MPRKGRALELLVRRLEAVASAGEANIRSPDYVLGRNSESNREVDVAVRSQVGSTDVFVMFECRDRAGTEDVRWIEEIATKRDDVGANVAVAVTTNGFSTGAQNMARRLGIELRVVENITIVDVVSWLRLDHLEVQVLEPRAARYDIRLYSNTPAITKFLPFHRIDRLTNLPHDVAIFALWDVRNSPQPTSPKWLTAQQLSTIGFNGLRRSPTFEVAALQKWTEVNLSLSTEQAPTVAVRTVDGLFPLARFSVQAQIRVVTSQVPITLRRITDSQGRTTQIAEAGACFEGQYHTVSLVNSGDGIAVLMETTPIDANAT